MLRGNCIAIRKYKEKNIVGIFIPFFDINSLSYSDLSPPITYCYDSMKFIGALNVRYVQVLLIHLVNISVTPAVCKIPGIRARCCVPKEHRN